jgi:hypothetical protein
MIKLSKETENDFSEHHISKVWNELHERFGFNLKYWKAQFEEDLKRVSRSDSIESAFYQFGCVRINPLINQILGRTSGYPTFQNLIEYIVTGKKKA